MIVHSRKQTVCDHLHMIQTTVGNFHGFYNIQGCLEEYHGDIILNAMLLNHGDISEMLFGPLDLPFFRGIDDL